MLKTASSQRVKAKLLIQSLILHTMIKLRTNHQNKSISWQRGSSVSKQRSPKHLKRRQSFLIKRLVKVWKLQLSAVHKIKASLGIMGEKMRIRIDLERRFRSFKCDHQVESLAILLMTRNLLLKPRRRLRRKSSRRKMMTKRKLRCTQFKKFLYTSTRVKWKRRKKASSIHYNSSKWHPLHSTTQERPRIEPLLKKKSVDFPIKCSKTNLDKAFKQRQTLLSLYQRRCSCK
jgi:hypothetical protein